MNTLPCGCTVHPIEHHVLICPKALRDHRKTLGGVDFCTNCGGVKYNPGGPFGCTCSVKGTAPTCDDCGACCIPDGDGWVCPNDGEPVEV